MVEDAPATLATLSLELLAKFVADDVAVALLTSRVEEFDLLPVDVEVAATPLNLHDTRLRRADTLRTFERKLARNRKVDRVIDRTDLREAPRHVDELLREVTTVPDDREEAVTEDFLHRIGLDILEHFDELLCLP